MDSVENDKGKVEKEEESLVYLKFEFGVRSENWLDFGKKYSW